MSDADGVAAFLEERPDLEPALRAVLAVDEQSDTWTYQDVDIDSGAFGELVSRGIVEKHDGEYRLADRAAVAAQLGGDASPSHSGAAEATGSRLDGSSVREWLADIDRVALGALVGVLVFVAVFRLTSAPGVFRDQVVLTGNDPYFYRYWVEQLLFSPEVTPSSLGGIGNGEPLMVVTLAVVSGVFGGTREAAGVVLAVYPVVSAVLTGALVYGLARRVSGDRRIALAAVALLAIVPAHALRTSIGFADHHAFDYPWLVVTALALVVLLGRERLSLDRPTVLGAVGLAVGVSVQVLSWDAGALLVVPLGLSLAVIVPVFVRERRPLVPVAVPVCLGLVGAGVVTMGAHALFGWQTAEVALVPVLVLAGAVGLFVLGELIRRVGPERAGVVTLAAEGVIGLAGLFLVRLFVPSLWELFLRGTDRLLAPQNIAEVQSLFSGSLGIVFLFGFVLFLALPYLVWGTVRGARGDGRWLALSVYTWYFLALTTLQVRFGGELSPFVAVFAGLGFVHLAERVDISSAPRPFRGDADSKLQVDSGRLPRPDRWQVGAIVGLFLLVGLIGMIQVPVKTGQLVVDDDQYATASFLAEDAAARDLEYPDNYVFSEWGRNRVYNYFVSGESESYEYALDNFVPFVSATSPGTANERLGTRPGYVVTSPLGEAGERQMQTRLHQHWGSHTADVDGLGRYQALYASEDGRYRAFRVVPGAVITGPATGSSLTTSTVVDIPGASFTYERRVPIRANAYRVRVANPGEYVVDGETVRVTEADVVSGARLSLFEGPGASYWSFDEGTGTVAFDRWGGQNAETSATAWVDGVEGSALRFNRTARSRVSTGTFEGPPDAFTLSVWVRPTALDVSPDNDFRLLVRTDSEAVLVLEQSGRVSFGLPGNDAGRLAGGRLAVDEWSHVAVSYDGTTRQVYVDGELVARDEVRGVSLEWGNRLWLGASWTSSPAHGLTGDLDEVRLYDRPLSSDEVADLANRTTTD